VDVTAEGGAPGDVRAEDDEEEDDQPDEDDPCEPAESWESGPPAGD
jgi:hypothetical protein